MRKNWQQNIIIAFLLCFLLLTGCASNKPKAGTEKTYYGTVTDMAMSAVDERGWPKVSRPYITIQFEDGTKELFWRVCETEAMRGDLVQVESAIEESTDLLIATEVIVLVEMP